jgi:hypothetical protein
MGGRLRRDIVERQDLFVFVDDRRRDLFIDDLAKDTHR